MASTSKATLLCQVITGQRNYRSPLKAGIIMVTTVRVCQFDPQVNAVLVMHVSSETHDGNHSQFQ